MAKTYCVGLRRPDSLINLALLVSGIMFIAFNEGFAGAGENTAQCCEYARGLPNATDGECCVAWDATDEICEKPVEDSQSSGRIYSYAYGTTYAFGVWCIVVGLVPWYYIRAHHNEIKYVADSYGNVSETAVMLSYASLFTILSILGGPVFAMGAAVILMGRGLRCDDGKNLTGMLYTHAWENQCGRSARKRAMIPSPQTKTRYPSRR